MFAACSWSTLFLRRPIYDHDEVQSYSVVLRVETSQPAGNARKGAVRHRQGRGRWGPIDIVGFNNGCIIRDIEASAADLDTAKLITAAVRRIKEIKVLNVADRTLLIHQGGKIATDEQGSAEDPR